MLTKDLLRVTRAGGGYTPRFTENAALAARVLGVYQGHRGETRGALADALDDLEGEAEDFKLVRGFAKLLDRDAVFETQSAVRPERARELAFREGERLGVVTDAERETALERASETLDTTPDALADALYADLDARQVLVDFDPRWDADALVSQYNLSLAQTALFDAVELRVETSEPRDLVLAVKRLGLLYEIEKTENGRVVVLTGPDAVFRKTRRYGTRFARLLRSVVNAEEFRVEATIDDRGTERTMVLTDDDPLRPPGVEPVVDVSYDSDVERDFATRFESLDLDWALEREPDFLDAGDHVMIPDFAFTHRYGDVRVYFEIMGFWTPEYVEKKLAQLDATEENLVVAVDESLGVGEDIEARDHRVVTYAGTVRVKDVVDVLRDHEADIVADAAADLPDELTPDDDVLDLDAYADRLGVPVDAVEDRAFPEHELVGRTLVRPAVLETLADDIDAGQSLDEAEDALDDYGLTDASAVLARLGYRVEWDGLTGGTVREK
ncbi:DUF790 family protein [Halocalculus aciditolerans]|uniref:DUF790 family protein n=1 Tax=Halocalculus aciditolerans TaxID=1383812 RepID=A0A830F4K2_9EURY|nr:DUF790 family protein [Halocalculus aciditolerans]GGL62037.1 hypothetical protein GCM10009039_20290 [Halocalculus aciditolerans]